MFSTILNAPETRTDPNLSTSASSPFLTWCWDSLSSAPSLVAKASHFIVRHPIQAMTMALATQVVAAQASSLLKDSSCSSPFDGANFSVDCLNGGQYGFTITNVPLFANGLFGVRALPFLNTLGDVNGDDCSDLAIWSTEGNHVVFGQPFVPQLNFDLRTLNETTGFSIPPYTIFQAVGDVDLNHDGLSDLALGDGSGLDPTRIIFGSETGFLNLDTLNGTNGFSVTRPPNQECVSTVSPAGDFNGDGFPDLLLGFPCSTNLLGAAFAGAVFVYFGSAEPFGPSLDLSTLNGTNGFAIFGLNTQ